MKEDIIFLLGTHDCDDELRKLQNILDKSGIEARIVRRKERSQEFTFLELSYDTDIVRIKKNRNAGRHYIGHKGIYTCGEIRNLQKSMSNRKLAEMLGLSERTLYRRLSEHENDADEEEFL